jgi:hypothetical protein
MLIHQPVFNAISINMKYLMDNNVYALMAIFEIFKVVVVKYKLFLLATLMNTMTILLNHVFVNQDTKELLVTVY